MPFYPRGSTEIKVGDKVNYGDSPGEVVFVIDDGQFSPNYPKEEWSSLPGKKGGIGILTKKFGLVVDDEPVEDLILVEPAK